MGDAHARPSDAGGCALCLHFRRNMRSGLWEAGLARNMKGNRECDARELYVVRVEREEAHSTCTGQPAASGNQGAGSRVNQLIPYVNGCRRAQNWTHSTTGWL